MATVSRNIFWSAIAAGLQIYTGGIVFILMARMMSIDDFGLLSFGFSLGTLLSTCLDFGQSLMIMKDYLQEKFQANRYVLNSMAQKVLLILVFCPLFLLYLLAFYEGEWIRVGAAFILFAIINAYTLYLQAFLRVENKFRNSSISNAVYALCITAAVLCYYFTSLSNVQLVSLMIVGKSVQLLVTTAMCRSLFQRDWFSLEIQKFLLKNSWSFGAHFIFGTFYFTIDTQIIALLLNARDVALYQAVFRIIYIFLIVSDISSNALLPYLSSKFAAKQHIGKLATNLLYLLLIVGSGLFLFFTLFNKSIIEILYSEEYVQAFPIVLPLSLVILLRTSASVYGSLLTISNNQTNRVKVVFISMVLSIALNFLFIPVAGILAAAWISVIVHLALWAGYFRYSRKEFPDIGLFTKENVSVLGITAIIFLLSNQFFEGNILLSIGLFAGWLVLIMFGMKRFNKYATLKAILKDKGVH